MSLEMKSVLCVAKQEDKLEGMPLSNVDILRLATARSAELAACEAGLGITTARAITQLQRLPVRLRRRAASHHPRRLPRRLHHQSVVCILNITFCVGQYRTNSRLQFL